MPATGAVVRFFGGFIKVHVDPGYKKKTCVFTQNHVSLLDGPIACASLPVPICGLENATHLHIRG